MELPSGFEQIDQKGAAVLVKSVRGLWGTFRVEGGRLVEFRGQCAKCPDAERKARLDFDERAQEQ